MGMWQQLAVIALAVAVVLLLGPGVKRMAEESPSGSREDWWTFVRIMAAVVGFILLLILFLRN
ncbi:MAG: hypothetical protein ACLFRB_01480 [Thiohalorhabdus sp.]|uniref:hypothetical protein n=1 Tax=Thiohalorhabdus sp. TaxID=3094134 RepID=UPI00397FF7A7